MSDEMLMLISMMKQEFEKQTLLITNAVSEKIMQKMDEKIEPLLQENKNLKVEIATLNTKIISLENMNRRNNLLLHGINETENNYTELFLLVSEILAEMGIQIDNYDINKMHRMGRQNIGKVRPILISLTTYNKKIELLKSKKKMPPNTYMTEDFSKETLGKRKELQKQVIQEREKGNEAYIRNNKIIVKQKENERRKRGSSESPDRSTSQQESGRKKIFAPAKLHKTDPFASMRARSHSLSEKPKPKA